ncbi:MAG TPA: CAP domain-containing protein, partial [Anaerovoracaceae bacterium]|nr:CAP domain-containing protein [Anaerovoracaceae bacterium]
VLLVMAVPAQAFAAEQCDVQTTLAKNNNITAMYNQIKEQIGKAGNPAQLFEQFRQAPQTKQNPAQQPQQTGLTRQNPAAVPEQNTTTAAQPAAPATDNETAAPASANLGDYEQQVVNLVNQERAAAGLPALKVNTQLAAVAEKKAEDLRDNNYFDHNSPVYGSPFDMMKQFGISYTAAGENIAKGQKTPADVMNGWMNSSGHRANILNADYTEIGVGFVTDSSGTTYWVQHFIRP